MNTENKTINETIKRTKSYWYVDGFSEIGVGLLLIVIILYNEFVSRLQGNTLQIVLLTVGLPLMIFLGSRGINWVVKKLKTAITYPRTGYVTYQRKSGSRRWQRVLKTAFIGAIAGALTSLLSGALPEIFLYGFVTLMLTLVYIYIGYMVGVPRFYFIAGGTVLLALALIFTGVNEDIFLLDFFIGQGTLWIISGLVALGKYLASTQPPAGQEEL
jgi:hypothetical protein